MAEASYQKITNPYGTNNWGFSLDAHGSHAIVGDNGLGTGVLHKITNGVWAELVKLTYTGNIGSSQWGRTVSIWEVSDTEVWIVVAGRGQDSPGTNAGAVWLYKWNGSTCVQQSNSPFQGSDTIAGDNFGSALAITVDSAGNGWIVVGAHEHTSGKGKGYLFKFPTSGGSEGVVTETDDFVPTEASAGAGVGQHEGAAIQADYAGAGQHQLAIGGYLHEDDQPQQGGVWVYTFGSSGEVTPAKYITEGLSGDHIGYSIAFGNGFLVTNARIIAPSSYNGARIYRGGGATWTLEDSVWDYLTDTTGDTLVGASYNAVVVGQASWDLPASGAGSCVAWKFNGTIWTKIYGLQPDDVAGLDYHGCAVDITGKYILSGQYGDDDAGSGDGAWYSYYGPLLPGIAPTVQNQDPVPDSEGNRGDGDNYAEVVHEEDDLDPDSVKFWFNGVLAWENGGPSDGWTGSAAAVTNGLGYTMTPDVSLESGVTITARVYATNNSGDGILDTTWEFDTLIVLDEVVVIETVDSPIISTAGGHQMEARGLFPVDRTVLIHQGPLVTTADPLCYGGQGLGYEALSLDGETLRFASPPLEKGWTGVTVVDGADEYKYGEAVGEPHDWGYLSTDPPTGFSASNIKAVYQFDDPALGLTDRTGNGHTLSFSVAYGYAWVAMKNSFGCNGILLRHGNTYLSSAESAALGTLGVATWEFVYVRYRMGNIDDTINGYVSCGGSGEGEAQNECFSIYGSSTRNRLGFFVEYGPSGDNETDVNPDQWGVGLTGQMTYIAATRASDGKTYKLYVDGVYLCDTVLAQAPTGASSVAIGLGVAPKGSTNTSAPGAFSSARWSHGEMTAAQIEETYLGLRTGA
jgi:hypothetical protein